MHSANCWIFFERESKSGKAERTIKITVIFVQVAQNLSFWRWHSENPVEIGSYIYKENIDFMNLLNERAPLRIGHETISCKT